MMAWPTKPIGELCDLINGRAFKPSDWGTEGLAIVRIQNLNDQSKPFNKFDGKYSNNHFIDNGAILLSWSGTPGTSFGCFRWLRGPGLLNQHIFKVIIQDNIMDGDFFIYAVNSRLDEMISQAHGGVGLRHITKAKLDSIHLPVPKLEEQRRIIARIKECMERVEALEKLQVEKSKAVNILYKSRLVELFDKMLSDSPFLKFGDLVAETKLGLVRSKKDQSEERSYPYVRMQDITNEGHLKTSSLIKVDANEKEVEAGQVKSGDFLFNTRNSYELVGKTAIVPERSKITLYNNNILRVRFKKDKVLSLFINHLFQHAFVKSQLEDRKNKTTSVCAIYWHKLATVKIPVPPLKVQERFVEHADIVSNLQRSIVAEMKDCEIVSKKLRKSILRKAFAGEL